MEQAFTAGELVELVHRYYPANRQKSEPEYRGSEQFQRLVAARAAAEQERGPMWHAFLDRLRATLPDCIVWDLSYLRHDNCHRVRVYAPGTTRESTRTTAVMACVSILAPVYLLYNSYQEVLDGNHLPTRTFYEPRPETQRLEEVLNSCIHEAFGFTRLPNGILFTPVPDLASGHARLGEATLADLLFTDGSRIRAKRRMPD